MSETPNKKLLSSLLSRNAASIGEKLGEVAIDNAMSASILKDIPIIGTALGLYNAGNDIQAYLFLRKITNFLTEIEKVSYEERCKFLCGLTTKEKSNLGDTLLLHIDNLTDLNCAKYLGRSFMLLSTNEISLHTFNMYCHIISNLSEHVLEQLKFCYQFSNFIGVCGDSMYFLNSLGIIDINWKVTIGKETKLTSIPEQNELGQAFYSNVIVACENT